MLNEEFKSYGLESIFINVQIQKTMDFIIDETYDKYKLSKILSKLIFWCFISNLTRKNLVHVNVN